MFNITPLCDAFARGYLSIAKILIAHGADLNTTNSANQDVVSKVYVVVSVHVLQSTTIYSH